MKSFEYEKPATPSDAIARGQAERARFIAGGTTLVDLLRLDVEAPDLLVDLTALPLGTLEVTPNGLEIGALVRNTELAVHPAVLADFPVLSQALLSGASPQLRNMATLGGNLLQRTRCSYFRDVAVGACNKRNPGSGCAAINGYSRMHAIVGVSEQCIAAHPSDMCVALLALDAVVHTQGPSGPRAIAIADFHTPAGAAPQLESVLKQGELVIGVTVPKSKFAGHSAYVKARDRASYAFALASAAVGLELDGAKIVQARVALGGVGSKPWRCPEVERALLGQAATRAAFQSAASLALGDAKTTRDNQFKVELARRVIVRALEKARDKA
ncbi:MAG TPA: xanthine dehydrogenase family protein subunit M [Polyangiaceae bacterium]|jgi:xanthine dehydrogenase YagS FAD-binding subunit|nr:xanthine dehydrogenase family protein subunit M [Polyangiaceae bacterium]